MRCLLQNQICENMDITFVGVGELSSAKNYTDINMVMYDVTHGL